MDEEARAKAYRDQTQRRKAAIDARERMLAGSDAAADALKNNWSALTNAGAELDPERDYDGRYPGNRADADRGA